MARPTGLSNEYLSIFTPTMFLMTENKYLGLPCLKPLFIFVYRYASVKFVRFSRPNVFETA